MAMANRNLKRKATEISEHPLVDAFNFSSSQLHPADFIETEVDLEEETNFNVGEEKNRVYATTGLRCDECDQDIREDSQNLFYYRIFGEHSLRRNHRVLALSCPTHGKVLGFKMKNSWWSLEELLTSRDTKRDGVLKVTTFGERIVLSVLNGIISTMELQGEKSLKFDLQPPNEAASIAWQKGVAVGFYTVKRKGRLISPYSGEVWALNILDTVFVRRSYRCRGLGKAMLEDFLESHASEDVGLSFPVEYPMMKVCHQVLVSRKKDRERLWECEEPGYPSQRRNIWLAVNSMLLPPKTEK